MAPVFYQTSNPASYVMDFTTKNLFKTTTTTENYSLHLDNIYFLSIQYIARQCSRCKTQNCGGKMEALAQPTN